MMLNLRRILATIVVEAEQNEDEIHLQDDCWYTIYYFVYYILFPSGQIHILMVPTWLIEMQDKLVIILTVVELWWE